MSFGGITIRWGTVAIIAMPIIRTNGARD